MLSGFASGLIAEIVPETGNVRVRCNRCVESIGSMSMHTAQEAILNTLGRGGVLCPKCREKTCDSCGIGPQDVLPFLHSVGQGVVNICEECHPHLKLIPFEPGQEWGASSKEVKPWLV